MNRASNTPETVAPASAPPRASTPKKRPTKIGTRMATTPGITISLSAAAVEMSTQRAESGLAVPSMMPGISRNCRRTSSTMPAAARPTAVIVSAAMKNGVTPPTNRPMTTSGSIRLMPVSRNPTALE